MKMHAIKRDLLALRSGELTFDAFFPIAKPVLEARATWFVRRWSQSLYAVDDLVQELAIDLWRAVDSWDPSRCADIVRYVDSEVGRCGQRRMRYACGWPDPRRSAPAQQVWVESVEDHLGSVPATAEATAMEREIGDAFVDFVEKRLVDKTRPGFVGAVIRLVVEGHDATSASKAIFGDADARRVYRLADEYEAEHATKRVVRKALTMTDAFVSRRPRFRVAESSPS